MNTKKQAIKYMAPRVTCRHAQGGPSVTAGTGATRNVLAVHVTKRYVGRHRRRLLTLPTLGQRGADSCCRGHARTEALAQNAAELLLCRVSSDESSLRLTFA